MEARWFPVPKIADSSPPVHYFHFAFVVAWAINIKVMAFVAEWLRRNVQGVVNIVGVGSSPTECIFNWTNKNDDNH